MGNFEVFREALRNTLYHLRDDDLELSEVLCQVMGGESSIGSGPIQARIIAEIKQLQPEEDTPPERRAWLHYQSLDRHFVQGLSQEETADLLHMSVRNLQRIQKEAVHNLALRFWQNETLSETATHLKQATDWQTQANREIRSVGINAPDAQADVADVIQSVVDLEAALAGGRGVGVTIGFIQEDLYAMVHSSILRQTLLTAISNVTPHISSPEITLHASLEDGQVKITLTGTLEGNVLPAESDLTVDIIMPPEATISIHQRGERIFLQILLPMVGECIVLVIEDNPDMVYFYRRSTTGTRYRIIQGPATEQIFDFIDAIKPDAIILDVMLPEIDGWQLLTHLNEGVNRREIPVIVCSVVKEENLALALGAAAFLSKPIHPHQLVAALDQALLQAPVATVKALKNNATTA